MGVDLSTGMIELAKEAIAKYQEQQQAKGARPEGTAPSRPCAAGGAAGAGGAALEAHVGDASSLDEHAPAAAVVSVFGLQQMGAVAPQVRGSGQYGLTCHRHSQDVHQCRSAITTGLTFGTAVGTVHLSAVGCSKVSRDSLGHDGMR